MSESQQTSHDPARRKYRNPPIEEALCEIRFKTDSEWDPTIPGLVFQQLRDRYPARPGVQGVVEAGVDLSAVAAGGGPSVTFRQNSNRVQLFNDERTRLVTVGHGVLGVHQLRPYSDWETFRDEISHAVDRYTTVSGTDGIVRIGVRYINRIVVSGAAVDLNEYFTSPPDPPPSMPQEIRSFLTRIDASYADAPFRLQTTFASHDAPDDKTAFILDIDVIAEYPESETLGVDQAMGVIDDLRSRERIAFEALITDKAREVFDDDDS